MKTLHAALALGLFSLVVACGDDGETTTSSGSGGSPSGSGGEDAGSGGDTSGSPQGSSSSSTASTASGEGGNGDGGSGAGGNGEGGSSPLGPYCTRRAADRDRFVVVGHPFGDGDYATDWEVLALSQAGELTTTGNHFQMGTAEDTQIAFSADGSIGIAVQRDYDLGVFSLDEDGTPTVIDASAFGIPDVTPSSVTLAASGDYFIVGDVNFPKNGGGLYRIDIDCETGDLSFGGLVIESKNAWSVAALPGDRWVVGAVGVDAVEGGADLHVVAEGDPWTREGGADPFEYEDASPQCIAAAQDGSFAVIGDAGLFSENHVALIDLSSDTPLVLGEPIQINGPYSVAISPEGDTAVVAGFEPDALYVFDIDRDGEVPFSLRGEVEYSDNGAQIPGAMAQITRGSLNGLTLVTDVQGVRVLRMGGGDVVDDDVLVFGEEPPFGTYGIGVQP